MDTINRIPGAAGNELEPTYHKRRGLILLRQTADLIFVSGHGPEDQRTGQALFNGRVGKELTLEQGYAAARECAMAILGGLYDYLGSLEHIKSFVRVFGMVNCAEGFDNIGGVMDGFSDIIMEVFGERGYHARTAMGTHNMPNNNIPVEVEAIVAVA